MEAMTDVSRQRREKPEAALRENLQTTGPDLNLTSGGGPEEERRRRRGGDVYGDESRPRVWFEKKYFT
ncbi:hypothetical protein EYF80_066771 [Liparis tanakae]|uniref:Uncharacterized protein n=1 Tax=Liparis tanakae TaxID=230148 RepID=A0A4Z2E431_9TELE|nr:hypothetical protein EYF80_066771 [Liparis tanakae]